MILLFIINSVYSDAIGTYGDAIAKCPSDIEYVSGLYTENDAEEIYNSSTSAVRVFEVPEESDLNITTGDELFVFNVTIGDKTDSSSETITKSQTMFNVSYHAYFNFTHDRASSSNHLMYINESSSNNGPIFEIHESSINNNSHVNTLALNGILFQLCALHHPIVYTEC